MEPAEIKTLAEERRRGLGVACSGLAVSVGLYMVVAWFLVRGRLFEPPLGPEVGFLPQLIALVGFLPLILAPLVSGALVRRIRGVDQGASPQEVVSAFGQATVVGFALREAGAIVGFVLTLLTGILFWALALGGATLLAMMMGWPRRDQLHDLLGLGPT